LFYVKERLQPLFEDMRNGLPMDGSPFHWLLKLNPDPEKRNASGEQFMALTSLRHSGFNDPKHLLMEAALRVAATVFRARYSYVQCCRPHLPPALSHQFEWWQQQWEVCKERGLTLFERAMEIAQFGEEYEGNKRVKKI
jgi:hypothetical protein